MKEFLGNRRNILFLRKERFNILKMLLVYKFNVILKIFDVFLLDFINWYWNLYEREKV